MTDRGKASSAGKRRAPNRRQVGGRPKELPGRAATDTLRARARQLARPLEEARPMDQPVNLLVFALGKERYGVDMTHVVEVLPPGSVTTVPCTPPWLRGITSYRGWALSLVDLGVLLAVAERMTTFQGPVVVVQVEGMLFGFQVDEAPTVVQVDAKRCTSVAVAAGGPQTRFVRALTGERVGVLDLVALAGSGQLLVADGA